MFPFISPDSLSVGLHELSCGVVALRNYEFFRGINKLVICPAEGASGRGVEFGVQEFWKAMSPEDTGLPETVGLWKGHLLFALRVVGLLRFLQAVASSGEPL